MRVGIVGGPMAGMEIRLVDWEEGNYRITDKVGISAKSQQLTGD